MNEIDDANKADECGELMANLLLAPTGDKAGWTIDEIQDKLGWSHRKTTRRLLDLGSRVRNHKVRGSKGSSATKYYPNTGE